MLRVKLVAIAVACAAAVHADPRWDAGLDLHGTDAAFGSRRPIGIAGGLRQGDVEAGLVVDPLVFALGWETIDVTAGLWLAGDRAELVGGWRQSSGKLGTGRRYDEALLIGADWVVTLSPRYRLAFGAELVTSIYRHGADIGSDPIQLWPLTTDLAERMDLMLHARFEITGWL